MDVDVRRKYSSVDLQQVVVSLDVYQRPLQSIGKSGAALGFAHEAAVAETEKGDLYVIEKGVSHYDDVNYPARYREGECRIIQVTRRDIRDWNPVRSVMNVDPALTLEDLFVACGSGYNFLADNCWNSTHRMRARANKEEEDGLAWQGKAAIGVGAVAVGAAALLGLAIKAFTPGRKEDEKKPSSKQGTTIMDVEVRRKYSSVDLQQVVVSLDVYQRLLKSSGGKSGAVLGFLHEAAVAKTENGNLYVIEKSKDTNDDVNYPARYREGECRIIQVTMREIRDWKLVRSVKNVDSALTLEDLFVACGSGYNFLADNCWNSTHRMRARANKEEEDGLAWQEKAAAIGVGVGVGAALLGLAIKAFTSERKEDEKKKWPQKY